MNTVALGKDVARPASRLRPGASLAGPAPVDLRGLDYYARRQRLLEALRDLPDRGEVCLISDRAADVHWLRYEVEARTTRRYGWSLPAETSGGAHTIVRAT
ncbi:MAG TPA: hypothetical protein VFJ14_04850 [Nocardioidaceae bacterium]|nr:hypothetical protein [Nocardioidaceae bacterium]